MFSILIVDDHKHLVESMATTIPWEEYEVSEVHQAYSGKEALEVMDKNRIDIVVTDIRMPVMSGLELIKQVKSRYPDTDCILLTGYAEFPFAKRAIELQAADYLIKPVRDEELLASIRKITEGQKKRRKVQQDAIRADEALRELPQLKAELLAANTTAEQTVLEERDRLAHDIHDIVGHTLTTTLIQIEAAKRLLMRGEREGIRRLEQSQELVRQGLDDIRKTVRQIKQPGLNGNLTEELEQFICKAEISAHIKVSYEIDLPAPIQNLLVCKMIYHALQEGITNGIRHGNAAHFLFRLHIEESLLVFSLWNDGAPYQGDKSGFGLTAMKERVDLLGGSLSLSATGRPEGTLLAISVPFQSVSPMSDEQGSLERDA